MCPILFPPVFLNFRITGIMVARSTALSRAGAMGPDVVVVVGSSATIEHLYEFVDKTYEEKVKDVE